MVIPTALLKMVTDAAEASYPDEACGLLVGADQPGGIITVSQVEPTANVASDDTGKRFDIDPRARIALARGLRGGAQRVIGHYHSHPDHPALPSRQDLEGAFEPDLVWLITSVVAGRARDTTGWRLDSAGGCFRPMILQVVGPERADEAGRTINPDSGRSP